MTRAQNDTGDGYVDPAIPNPNGPDDAPIIIYGYTPTLALSILAIVLYALALALHSARLYRHRRWAFSILCLLTTVCEIVGYVFRLRSSPPPVGDPYNVLNFVIQYFFIVVAPVFFSAAIYTTLTSLIAALGQHMSPLGLSRRKIIWIFVTSDVLATITQVTGAALIGTAESDSKSPDTGNNILLAGLCVQVFSFLVFLVLLAMFLRRSRKATTSTGEGGLMRFSGALVVCSLLVYLRTIFRMAETAEGVGGYASSHEAFFGALEFAPIVVAILVLGWWHPGKWVPTTRPSTGTD
ncbi:hypothetical protein MMC22_011856 [Lobaria immixta]|nr:hypothetical protein [Lobaria immixta]